ncbi:hypothetical protein KAS41_01350 [Candidatus Parcubacteria bacterium]|nr:hypothetical protein [Candidatus Parcubacteria bacterium]
MFNENSDNNEYQDQSINCKKYLFVAVLIIFIIVAVLVFAVKYYNNQTNQTADSGSQEENSSQKEFAPDNNSVDLNNNSRADKNLNKNNELNNNKSAEEECLGGLCAGTGTYGDGSRQRRSI